MATSRRTFLKSTIAGASVAVGDLHGLANGPGAAAAAGPSAPTPAAAESSVAGGEYTRGIGIYPGDPSEDFAPRLVPEHPRRIATWHCTGLRTTRVVMTTT